MQPTYAAMLSATAKGNAPFRAISLTARRPPGFRTRAISRKTAGLSGARLMTQLLMTQSTDASGERKLVDRQPDGTRRSDIRHPGRSSAHARSSRGSCRCRLRCLSDQPVARPGIRPARHPSRGRPPPRRVGCEAIAVGFPQESPILASAGMEVNSSGAVAECLCNCLHACVFVGERAVRNGCVLGLYGFKQLICHGSPSDICVKTTIFGWTHSSMRI